jgi:hypothetical protein
MGSSYLQLGTWNVICDQCGVKRKADQVCKRWDGLVVCTPATRPGCFEHRQPQDFVRARIDDQTVPFKRPESTDQFVDVTYIASTVGTQENTKPTGTFDNSLDD